MVSQELRERVVDGPKLRAIDGANIRLEEPTLDCTTCLVGTAIAGTASSFLLVGTGAIGTV